MEATRLEQQAKLTRSSGRTAGALKAGSSLLSAGNKANLFGQ